MSAPEAIEDQPQDVVIEGCLSPWMVACQEVNDLGGDRVGIISRGIIHEDFSLGIGRDRGRKARLVNAAPRAS